MSDDALNKSIRQLVRTVTGMAANSVHPANQSKAPAGSATEPFATVLITSYQRQGWDETHDVDEASPSLNVAEVVDGQRSVSVSVQFFRAGAVDFARRLELMLNAASSVDLMQALGLGLVRVSPLKDLSAIVNTVFEQRAQLQIDFNVSASGSNSVPTFGTFPITISTPASSASFEVTSP